MAISLPMSRSCGEAHDPSGGKHSAWEPVSGAEVGARGSFDDQAHAHSPELWLSQHRGLLVAAVAGIVELAIAAARR